MSPLEVIQLIGYSTAAALHLWVGVLLLRRRQNIGPLERVLLALAFAVGAWHACNLLLTLHSMLGFEVGPWKTFLRLTNTVAVAGITLSYSLLLHVHLHLWANSRRRPLTFSERARVYLSYLPALFLTVAVWKLWREPYRPMYEKLSTLLLPFALWAVYCLLLVAVTDYLIARSTQARSEARLLKTLAASFVGIASLIFAVYVLRLYSVEPYGSYLQTFANLGSLVPTALLAYQIYRYHYLELIIRESLIVASLAAVILVAYLYGVRTLGEWLTAHYQLRAGVVESILILTLALVAAPLRDWLDRRFHRLFEREAALYRDVVTSIGANAGRYQQLPELLGFVEERIASGLGLRRVKVLAADEGRGDEPAPSGSDNAPESFDSLRAAATEHARAYGDESVEGLPELRAHGFELAIPLRREEREVGLLLVDAPPEALTRDVRAVLGILAGQVAIAIEDCRLVAENVQLERRLAQRERLAALGQMAATVAHEVKNPLSAIKSIVQVMREDEAVGREYRRDLELIVGETDRLSRSLTQMLSFARHTPPPDAPRRAQEVLGSVTRLMQAEADERGVEMIYEPAPESAELDGAAAAALRDAVSNLLVNALHVTPRGGRVRVDARAEGGRLHVAVADEGPGVPENLRERIWEPFFTTKQRGTGLGLPIVRKRVGEVGGTARLAHDTNGSNGRGARFELVLPLQSKPSETHDG